MIGEIPGASGRDGIRIGPTLTGVKAASRGEGIASGAGPTGNSVPPRLAAA
jgi:hypothetical protein